MKKLLRALTAVGTAALAVTGGICIYQKFFKKDEELDDAFDDEELFDEDQDDAEEDEVESFDTEEEIFAEESEAAPAEESAEDTEPEKTPDSEE